MTPKSQAVIVALLLIPALIFTYFAYTQGINGPYIYDDWGNLPFINTFDEIDSLDGLKHFIETSNSGPTGRPLSFLSFWIDSQTWPAEPAQFKHTNILLHMLCGTFLFWAILLLCQLPKEATTSAINAPYIALTASTLWMLHPLWVSTVLYTVQRMSILAAAVSIATFVCYLYLRRGQSPSTFKLTATVYGGTGLAMLAKENAALLPLCIAVVESIWIRSRSTPLSRQQTILLFAPSIAAFSIYALWIVTRGQDVYSTRSFSLGERLLTQPRMLFDYAYHLLWPLSTEPSIYADAVTPSKTLLDPPSSLLTILALASIAALAIAYRRKHASITLAILFFLTAHLLESSFLPLEMRFEHRNYLPSLLLGLPIAIGLTKLPLAKRVAITIFMVGTLAWGLFIRSDLWSDKLRMQMAWYSASPHSSQTATALAGTLLSRGEQQAALQLAAFAKQENPRNLNVALLDTLVHCRTNTPMPGQDIPKLLSADRWHFDFRNFSVAEALIEEVNTRRCNSIDKDDILPVLIHLSQSSDKRRSGDSELLFYLIGETYLAAGNQTAAKPWLKRSIEINNNTETRARIVASLATHGRYCLALELIQTPEATQSSSELQALRQLIQQDISKSSLHCKT